MISYHMHKAFFIKLIFLCTSRLIITIMSILPLSNRYSRRRIPPIVSGCLSCSELK